MSIVTTRAQRRELERMKSTLTPREQDVLHAIRTHVRTWHEAPTRHELGAALGMARPTVEQHLQRMAGKGAVRLEKRWRGIEV